MCNKPKVCISWCSNYRYLKRKKKNHRSAEIREGLSNPELPNFLAPRGHMTWWLHQEGLNVLATPGMPCGYCPLITTAPHIHAPMQRCYVDIINPHQDTALDSALAPPALLHCLCPLVQWQEAADGGGRKELRNSCGQLRAHGLHIITHKPHAAHQLDSPDLIQQRILLSYRFYCFVQYDSSTGISFL